MRQLTLPAQAPGCTLQIVHASNGFPKRSCYPYSLSLYARAATATAAEIVQLVYAPADRLEITQVSPGHYTLWARADGHLHVCFEITRDSAEAVAAFAGMTLPPAEEAA